VEETLAKLKELIDNNDIWFVAGGGYHYIKNCEIVEGKLIIGQQDIPDFI